MPIYKSIVSRYNNIDLIYNITLKVINTVI